MLRYSGVGRVVLISISSAPGRAVPTGNAWEGAEASGVVDSVADGAAVWGDAGGASSKHCSDVGTGCQVVAEVGPDIMGMDIFAVSVNVKAGGEGVPFGPDVEALDIHRGYKGFEGLLGVRFLIVAFVVHYGLVEFYGVGTLPDRFDHIVDIFGIHSRESADGEEEIGAGGCQGGDTKGYIS